MVVREQVVQVEHQVLQGLVVVLVLQVQVVLQELVVRQV